MSELIPKYFFELTTSNEKYWLLLKEQIEKDFQRIGSQEIDLDTSNTANWIKQISDICSSLDQSNQLENLLYLIDLPENWSANLKLSDNYYSDLSHAIIQREWVKIYYRMNY